MHQFSDEDNDVIRNTSRRVAARLLNISIGSSRRQFQRLMAPIRHLEELEREADRHRRRRGTAPGTHWNIPDPQALAERERRLDLQHPTFTAMHLGDPLPGYSALDRRS